MCMKINRNDIGRFCTVKFDDSGLQEALILEVDSKYKRLKVYMGSGGFEKPEFTQIKQLGKRLDFNTTTTGI